MEKFESEKECLAYIITGIENLYWYHLNNETYYDTQLEWKKKGYGWRNPYFPPEYREHCLKETSFEMKPSCDLYYFMVSVYERIRGTNVSVNWKSNRKWKSELVREHMQEWDKDTSENIFILIQNCTCTLAENRIKNASELKNSEAFHILLNRFGDLL